MWAQSGTATLTQLPLFYGSFIHVYRVLDLRNRLRICPLYYPVNEIGWLLWNTRLVRSMTISDKYDDRCPKTFWLHLYLLVMLGSRWIFFSLKCILRTSLKRCRNCEQFCNYTAKMSTVSYLQRTYCSLDLRHLRVFQHIFHYIHRVIVLVELRCKSVSGYRDHNLDWGCFRSWKVLVICHDGQLDYKINQGQLS